MSGKLVLSYNDNYELVTESVHHDYLWKTEDIIYYTSHLVDAPSFAIQRTRHYCRIYLLVARISDSEILFNNITDLANELAIIQNILNDALKFNKENMRQ